MATSLIPAVSACTAIQSLVLSLFIGSSAAASLEEQWRAISILIAAARNTALRRVLLFFVHCGEPALDEDVVRFGRLQWTSLTQELARCRCLEVVEFQIVGFEAGIAGDIEGKVRWGLSSIRGNEWAPGNEKPIALRASREPPLMAFEGSLIAYGAAEMMEEAMDEKTPMTQMPPTEELQALENAAYARGWLLCLQACRRKGGGEGIRETSWQPRRRYTLSGCGNKIPTLWRFCQRMTGAIIATCWPRPPQRSSAIHI